jgi:hypothetical protein
MRLGEAKAVKLLKRVRSDVAGISQSQPPSGGPADDFGAAPFKEGKD